MAHRLYHERNPEFLGIEMTDVAEATVGLSLTGLANDKIVAPLIDKLIPSLKKSALARKLVDAGTTLATAFAWGLIAEVIPGVKGAMVQFGGAVLGTSRLVTAFVPNYQISGTTPIDTGVAGLFRTTDKTPADALGGEAAPGGYLGGGGVSGTQQASQADPNAGVAQTAGVSQYFLTAQSIGGTAYSFKGGA